MITENKDLPSVSERIAKLSATAPPLRRITGIGSLPHHNVDTALAFSFKMGIPFLPQIPIRNPWEYMLPQALEGLTGLQIEDGGVAVLNSDIWENQSQTLAQRLEKGFAHAEDSEFFEIFEPSAATSSCWQPFLWELQERESPLAKIQIAGPFTTQWALKLKNGASPDRYPDLATQIYRLVLARALAMVNRLKSLSIQPIIYLDEPGLYTLSLSNPKHSLGLQELKIMIQSLKKAGAIVGIHCCSNTHWEAVLKLGIDILSLDTGLSLRNALAQDAGRGLENFISSGGLLSLGIVPTTRPTTGPTARTSDWTLDTQELIDDLVSIFAESWEKSKTFDTQTVQRLLKEAIYTPACGLAFQSTSDVEMVLDKLTEVYEYFHS